MIDWRTWRWLIWEIAREARFEVQQEVDRFSFALEDWINALLSRPMPADWRRQTAEFLHHWEHEGFRLTLRSIALLDWWIEAWAKRRGFLPKNEEPPAAGKGYSSSTVARENAPVARTTRDQKSDGKIKSAAAAVPLDSGAIQGMDDETASAEHGNDSERPTARVQSDGDDASGRTSDARYNHGQRAAAAIDGGNIQAPIHSEVLRAADGEPTDRTAISRKVKSAGFDPEMKTDLGLAINLLLNYLVRIPGLSYLLEIVSAFRYTKAVRWNTPPLGRTSGVTQYVEARYLNFANTNARLARGGYGSRSLEFKKTWKRGAQLKKDADGTVLAAILNEARSNSVDAIVSMKWDPDAVTYTFKASWEWHDHIDLNSFRQGWANVDTSTWTSTLGTGALWVLEGGLDAILDKASDFDYPFVGVWHEDVTVVLPRDE